MKKVFISATALGVLIVGLAVVSRGTIQTLFAGCQFLPSSLQGKSSAVIERAALDYACTNFKSVGKPHVRYNRIISPQEYMALFGGDNILCKDQDLALIVLEGDFELTNMSYFGPQPPRAKYVGLLFDLKVGVPTSINYSKTGEGFREVLNDSALPERQFALAPVPKNIRACTYGETAPTIMPPK